MNERLRHRGPDSAGVYIDDWAGLAIRRLAIIDVEGGQQPIANEDGSIVLVFNGEIYNYRELREDLIEYGHRFRTQSDTEVIVHAYEQWGEEALSRLNGMFAIALWNSLEHRLLLARDRMGEKPLYWHHSPNGLLFASEAKAILAAPWVGRQINALSLHHYLSLQYTPDPLTIYEDIHQLPAAHKLVMEANGTPAVTRWWQLEFEPKCGITGAEAEQRARSLLRLSVRRRMISEVPLGVFLSGGLDSSVVVALAAEEGGKPLPTFTIGFDEERYSEAPFARRLAGQYGTDHHEFVFSSGDLRRVAEAVAATADGPVADPAALPLYELARQARLHVTVALSGDGGDETLAGYLRYALDSLLRSYAALPAWLTQKVVPAALRRIPERGSLPEDRSLITGLKRLSQFAAVTPKASILRWGSYFNHDQKLALYTRRWRDELANVKTADWIAAAYDEAHAGTALDSTLHADHVTYLSGDLLPKTDRMTMAHSLEARAPLLDPEWVEWTARLRGNLKVRGLSTKRLLRKAFADMLPGELIGREKQGFGVPLGPWLRGPLQEWAEQSMMQNREFCTWIRPDAVGRLFSEHQQGRVNNGKRIWCLLMLALWMNSSHE